MLRINFAKILRFRYLAEAKIEALRLGLRINSKPAPFYLSPFPSPNSPNGEGYPKDG